MAMTTNVSEAVKPSIEVGKSEVTELIRGSYEKNGQFSNPEELFLAEELVEIFYETELPRFGVTHITTVKNETVKEKADLVLGLLEITTHAIPLYQQREFPLKFDEDTLKKAPWVNMIHAWMKVLNELNSISEMQRNNKEFSVELIASIAYVLYRFTVDSEGDRFIRSNDKFLSEGEYVETFKRKSGTEGANARRLVNIEEMKHILKVAKLGFRKR